MRYSRLFGKTTRNITRDAVLASHKLLLQAGFIKESSAGKYYFLPLGWRTNEKIRKIIKEEMDKAGAQEMLAPVLHPLELWKETNRTSTTGFELLKVKDRNGNEFALGGTAEEMFVDLVRKMNLTHKDLPFNIYQFSTKFRDEMRPRGGLLRVREFVMKDAYSFDKNETEFKKTYELMKKTYTRIFERLGLQTTIVESDNGYIGGEYCHEFVVESEVGESRYFVEQSPSDPSAPSVPSGSYAAHEDVCRFRRDPINPDEPEKPFEIIAQPEWVHTMDDNVKHYKLPKSHFLKNVVYKNKQTGEIIIATLRGDLDINPVKLEHAVHAEGLLTPATDQDLASIGTKRGYVHSWGYENYPQVHLIGDLSLTTVKNFIGGLKTEKTDSINVNLGRDFKCEKLADIAMVYDGALSENGKELHARRGIEVGNIFQLGLHYTNLMKGAEFVNENGLMEKFYMGCYGIGLGRTLAAIVEKMHDEKGILWPDVVTPFRAHLITLFSAKTKASDKESIWELANDLHNQCPDEVLWDEREEVSAGVKFVDADLIGCPLRMVISEKTIRGENTPIELCFRSAIPFFKKNLKLISIEQAKELITSTSKELLTNINNLFNYSLDSI